MKQLKQLRIVFLLVGAVILTVLIHNVGLANIWHEVAALDGWLLPIFCMSGIWYGLYTCAWRHILTHQRSIGFWQLFRIKMAGEAVNCSTPINFLGGDPLRIYLLRRYFPWTHGTASVVIDRTLQSMATIAIVSVGAIVAFWHIPNIPMNIRYGLPVVLLAVSGFIAFIFAHQRRGLFAFGMNTVKRLRIRRHFSEKTITRCDELDQLISDFYHRAPRRFWTALVYHTIARCFGMFEMYLIGHLVDGRFGIVDALILGALTPVINLIFSFIPGALGIMEGAYGGTLYLLHLSPSLGISIQIIKRMRAGLWIAFGYLCLYTYNRRQHGRHPSPILNMENTHAS